jgi:hypothetical protein
VNDEVMRNEAYTHDLSLASIELTSREIQESVEIAYVEFELMQNEPNPWMNSTRIEFNTPFTSVGEFNIMDVNGRIILSKEQAFNKGPNLIILNNHDIPQGGIYYYEIVLGDYRMMKKMVVVK